MITLNVNLKSNQNTKFTEKSQLVLSNGEDCVPFIFYSPPSKPIK